MKTAEHSLRLTVALALLTAFAAAGGDIERGFLGFRFHVTPEQDALSVVALYPDGPAERAGVEVDDRVVAVNGSSFRFTTAEQARHAFDWVVADELVELEVLRSGEIKILRLEASAMPSSIVEQENRAWARRQAQEALKALLAAARDEPVRLLARRGTTDEIRLEHDGRELPVDLLPLLNPSEALQTELGRLTPKQSLDCALSIDRDARSYQLDLAPRPQP
ncbi:MAG: PDZ domain-containing protein [Acidobacteriota bacterium]